MPYFREFQSAGGPKSESGVGGVDDEKLMPNDDHLHFMSSGYERAILSFGHIYI